MGTHIIYIPGLGARYNGFRRKALSWWRLYGVSTELIALDWYDGNTLEQRLEQVNHAIERVHKNSQIVVVGESAGATLALRTATLPRVRRVITLCGVAQPNAPISSYLQKKSPSLLQATRSIPDTNGLDIHSVRAIIDPVVEKKYSTATGAKSHSVWLVGHFFTIVACLTVFSPLMLTIAKKSNM